MDTASCDPSNQSMYEAKTNPVKLMMMVMIYLVFTLYVYR